MDNFWKWMKESGNDYFQEDQDCDYSSFLEIEEGRLRCWDIENLVSFNKYPKEFLIGYMIKYCLAKDMFYDEIVDSLWKNNSDSKEVTIESFYNALKNIIEDIKKLEKFLNT